MYMILRFILCGGFALDALSTEFWIGTVIAFVLFIIGAGMTLAMGAKSKGEFRFAVGCFSVSAFIVIYGIMEWEMKINWSARSRVPIAYVLFALTCLLTGEAVRWAHRKHLENSPVPPAAPVSGTAETAQPGQEAESPNTKPKLPVYFRRSAR